MGRIAAIDFGLKRIGIAISDPGKKIAFPLATVAGGPSAMESIQKALAAKPEAVERILIGLPILLNGKEGPMAEAARRFGAQLEKALSIPVEFVDERFSSKLADQSLKEISLNRKKRTEKMDETAATLLLQAYLETHA